MRNLNILIVGTGMYACGRGTEDYGTIMPAVLGWIKKNSCGEVYVAGKSMKGVVAAKVKIHKLLKRMDLDISIRYFPRHNDDRRCYEEAMREIKKPACAIIAVPDNLHKKVAEAAIKGGLHSLVVKPLVATKKEALDLIKLQNKKRVYCAVEFHKRFDYANLKLKAALGQGLIGDPLYFLAEFSQRKTIPAKIFKDWVENTNVFQYLGIHYVDIVYFSTGARPIRVMATGQKSWLFAKGVDTYDSIEAVIEWVMPSGKKFVSHILTNWVDPESTSAMSDQKIKVIGTKGRFESDQKNRGVTMVTDEGGIAEINPYFCGIYNQDDGIVYRGYGIDSIRQFLDDVSRIEEGVLKAEDLEDKRPTFRQSIVPTKILEGVNRSLKENGKWIPIKKS